MFGSNPYSDKIRVINSEWIFFIRNWILYTTVIFKVFYLYPVCFQRKKHTYFNLYYYTVPLRLWYVLKNKNLTPFFSLNRKNLFCLNTVLCFEFCSFSPAIYCHSIVSNLVLNVSDNKVPYRRTGIHFRY